MRPDILSWLKQKKKEGSTKEQLAQYLLSQGYDLQHVESIMKHYDGMDSADKSDKDISVKDTFMSNPWLFALGGLFALLSFFYFGEYVAGIVYLAIVILFPLIPKIDRFKRLLDILYIIHAPIIIYALLGLPPIDRIFRIFDITYLMFVSIITVIILAALKVFLDKNKKLPEYFFAVSLLFTTLLLQTYYVDNLHIYIAINSILILLAIYKYHKLKKVLTLFETFMISFASVSAALFSVLVCLTIFGFVFPNNFWTLEIIIGIFITTIIAMLTYRIFYVSLLDKVLLQNLNNNKTKDKILQKNQLNFVSIIKSISFKASVFLICIIIFMSLFVYNFANENSFDVKDKTEHFSELMAENIVLSYNGYNCLIPYSYTQSNIYRLNYNCDYQLDCQVNKEYDFNKEDFRNDKGQLDFDFYECADEIFIFEDNLNSKEFIESYLTVDNNEFKQEIYNRYQENIKFNNNFDKEILNQSKQEAFFRIINGKIGDDSFKRVKFVVNNSMEQGITNLMVDALLHINDSNTTHLNNFSSEIGYLSSMEISKKQDHYSSSGQLHVIGSKKILGINSNKLMDKSMVANTLEDITTYTSSVRYNTNLKKQEISTPIPDESEESRLMRLAFAYEFYKEYLRSCKTLECETDYERIYGEKHTR